MLRQDFVELAGHGRREADDLAAADLDPFRVRTGQDGDTLETRLRPEEAKQLCFLATHDVLSARGALADAGQDADPIFVAGITGSDGARQELMQVGWRLEVWGFDPALPGTSHAANDDIDGAFDFGAGRRGGGRGGI